MASTKADNNREAWTYTDDLGDDYRISSKTVYTSDGTDGAKYGGSQGDPADPPFPRGWKPRRVKCSASGKPDKWVIAYDPTATIWTTPGTTLTLDANGVDVEYTVGSKNARRSEKRTRDGITQTS